jgi:predicted nucleotidyltransferase
MKEVTSYPAINTLLTEWVEGLKQLLGEKIVGLYLSGSLAYGDFVPDRSDIDLQAVVGSRLTENELRSVERLHKEVERRCPQWANRIECSYVPLELVRELSPPAKSRPWWGFGNLYAEAPAGNEWIINHYLLARYGIALEGPAFQELIPSIDMDDVRQAMREICSKNGCQKLATPRGSRIAITSLTSY